MRGATWSSGHRLRNDFVGGVMVRVGIGCVVLSGLLASAAFGQAQPTLKFSFGPQAVAGYTQVKAGNAYSKEAGFGFDLGSKVKVVGGLRNDKSPGPNLYGYTTADNDRGFFFSAKVAPGAYRVTVTLGDSDRAAEATI